MGSIFVLLNAYGPTRLMVAVPCMDERMLALCDFLAPR